MGRIAETELIQLKRDVDLLSLVRESGVDLRRHGNDWIGRCKFHDDREPSLVVTPAKGLWQCLGACRAGGSAIDWVMRVRGVGFGEALGILRRQVGTATSTGRRSPTPPPAEPFAVTQADTALLERVWRVYAASYGRAQKAREYAASRGLADDEALDRFGLGYGTGVLSRKLERVGDAGPELREQLVRMGVLRESGREHLLGCLIFRIEDVSGKLVSLYGRRIEPGKLRHLYLRGPRRGVWNAGDLAGAGDVVLCESLIDAWTFWVHGVRNVTCTWGCNGLTDEHVATLRTAGTRRVLLAFDADAAGDAGAREVASRLAAEGLECLRVRFPRGMDANAYALSVTPSTKALEVAIRGAVPMPEKSLPVSRGPLPEAEPAAPPLAASSPASPARPAPPTGPAASTPPRSTSRLDRRYGDRSYIVRGLDRCLSYQAMKVLLRVGRGPAVFVDQVDLVSAKHRALFVRQAATELEVKEEVIKKDLGRLYLELEGLQDELIRRELEPKESAAVMVAPAAEKEALAWLKRPDVVEAILEDFAAAGIVGEETNKLVGYLAVVSRKLEAPLAVIVQSSSAAGKSSLMEAILAFCPEEDRVQYSAMTGQSLFYMGEKDLAHKVLAIVEEEGAERASYALKLLQSEGELSIASTGKDPATGKLVTHEYQVKGPVMLFLTTTSIEIDEELLNRCLVLTVDESREQTRAIHRLQRERRTLEGLLNRKRRSAVLDRHRNAQRLLRPLAVVNPWAPRLTFLDSQTRTRRDHEKYLTLIEAIALLHQHQRPTKRTVVEGQAVEYVEATLGDIALANRLAGEVLGRTLDELPPQTRRFLGLLDGLVSRDCEKLEMDRTDYRFHRRQVCEEISWSLTQVRLHIERLVEAEYVLVHRGNRGQSFVYELVYDGAGEDGKRFLPQLIDVEDLEAGDVAGIKAEVAGSAAKVAAGNGQVAGSKRGQNAPKTGRWRGAGQVLEA